MKDVLAAELAKPEPDLAAVAAAADKAQQTGARAAAPGARRLARALRDVSPDQKAVVKGILQQHLAKMESFHQKMLERHSSGG